VQWLGSRDTIAASDGSYKDDMGTSSWSILSKHDDTKITAGANFNTGRAQYQSSYQSELAGIFGIIVFISLAVEFYELDHGVVEVACDGIEAL
jgi:hypothetical protein